MIKMINSKKDDVHIVMMPNVEITINKPVCNCFRAPN